MIEKLNDTVRCAFDNAKFYKFAYYLMTTYQIDVDDVDLEILVALFKLFLNSPSITIGTNMTQILTTMSKIQGQTSDFDKNTKINLDDKLLDQLNKNSEENNLDTVYTKKER